MNKKTDTDTQSGLQSVGRGLFMKVGFECIEAEKFFKVIKFLEDCPPGIVSIVAEETQQQFSRGKSYFSFSLKIEEETIRGTVTQLPLKKILELLGLFPEVENRFYV
jgi:hypothetical protein